MLNTHNIKAEARAAGSGLIVVLVLLLLVVAATGPHLVPAANPGVAGRPGSQAFTTLEGRLEWYFFSGQWRADASTAAGMVRYLLTPEPRPTANQPPVRA